MIRVIGSDYGDGVGIGGVIALAALIGVVYGISQLVAVIRRQGGGRS